jgi:RNA polymerase sigma-70 factor, ECF subfamily
MSLPADPRAGEHRPEPALGVDFAWLYNELRALAQAELAGERRGHTLSATALVNEAYLKLSGGRPIATPSGEPLDRARFFGLAARAMRQILVDHARTRGRQKRGGSWVRVGEAGFDVAALEEQASPVDTLDLDEALTRLASQHPDAARVVELRFFAGLTEAATAEVLGMSERTVRRHWTFARASLHRELARDDDGNGVSGSAAG